MLKRSAQLLILLLFMVAGPSAWADTGSVSCSTKQDAEWNITYIGGEFVIKRPSVVTWASQTSPDGFDGFIKILKADASGQYVLFNESVGGTKAAQASWFYSADGSVYYIKLPPGRYKIYGRQNYNSTVSYTLQYADDPTP